MLLSCQNISKAFLEKQILSNVSFHIEDYDRVALIGINGAGKSTLLKIIIGEMNADSGIITLSKDKTIGYLAQHQDLTSSNTIYDELLSVKGHLLLLEQQMRKLEQDMKHLQDDALDACMESYQKVTHQYELENGYSYKSEVTGVLKGLGFTNEDFSKQVNMLSGGQKTRVSLGKLLLLNPDLIILDEPTNHLDLDSITWLETYLLNYKGSVLLVSHDRYFINKVANKVLEIENAKSLFFTGTYNDFAAKKEVVRNAQLKAFLNQQKEIKHQEAVIEKLKSFNREKSIKRAESREKMLDKIELLEKPADVNDEMKLKLTPAILSGNDVLTVTDLKKSFDDLLLFEHVDFQIKRGEHVAIIGKNGTGKTTLLKILNQIISADSGEFKLGSKVNLAYYDQEYHVLNDENTLFEEISDAYENLTNTQIRNTLAAFLFTGDDVYKRIKELSGGEKGRVSLAKLMLSSANFLVLDEPTNHLDITSKEILENAINQYEGTVLYVSHDRYFINKTATRILDLSNHGFTNYIGNYDYYQEHYVDTVNTDNPGNSSNANVSLSTNTTTSNALDYQEQKQQQALKRKTERQIAKLEEEINVIESRLEELDKQLLDPANACNVSKLQEISKEQEQLNESLLQKMEEWEALAN